MVPKAHLCGWVSGLCKATNENLDFTVEEHRARLLLFKWWICQYHAPELAGEGWVESAGATGLLHGSNPVVTQKIWPSFARVSLMFVGWENCLPWRVAAKVPRRW